ncbi:site-specific integrase [Paraburkholderia dipogonis]|uniref:Site-specific integrase n=2 Tax=Paraburkholderia dipogonis TaxID=1211383 RepID=A0A4Y8N9J1_9BURK|nr:site-specific integrase [Paraburkholderia dipogonis]TFE46426.1 site-specific integrase [Paraburkholderia dipogonis]
MASIRQRNGRWQVRIARKGYPSEVQTFDSKTAAAQWARSVETNLDRGIHLPQKGGNDTSFRDVLERYRETVTPGKRGAADEHIRIRAIQRQRIAGYSMANLTPEVIARFRDWRLQTVSPATVVRDLALISSAINHARREWQVQISNPCEMVRKPATPRGRDRMLRPHELDTLLDELMPRGRRSPWMRPLVLLALETAMRRGELLELNWQNVNLVARTAFLPLTKNGSARTVPLSIRAVDLLAGLPHSAEGPVFQITSMAVAAAFKKACHRAKIENFRFHDLRHMATTRLAEKLPNVVELASVTGHQTVQMLKRYYHPSAEALARKLD